MLVSAMSEQRSLVTENWGVFTRGQFRREIDWCCPKHCELNGFWDEESDLCKVCQGMIHSNRTVAVKRRVLSAPSNCVLEINWTFAHIFKPRLPKSFTHLITGDNSFVLSSFRRGCTFVLFNYNNFLRWLPPVLVLRIYNCIQDEFSNVYYYS